MIRVLWIFGFIPECLKGPCLYDILKYSLKYKFMVENSNTIIMKCVR